MKVRSRDNNPNSNPNSNSNSTLTPTTHRTAVNSQNSSETTQTTTIHPETGPERGSARGNETTDKIKVYFRNIRGLGNERKANQARMDILESRPTIFGLAETRISGVGARQAVHRWTEGSCVGFADREAADHRSSEHHGVLLAVPSEWAHRVRAVQRVQDRAVGVMIGLPRANLFVAVVLAPTTAFPAETAEMATVLQKWIDDAAGIGASIVLMGDYNGVLNSAQDRSFRGAPGEGDQPTTSLMTQLAASGLVDVWRCIYPEVPGHTRRGVLAEGAVTTARIDAIWASPTLVPTARMWLGEEDELSDHVAVQCSVTVRGGTLPFARQARFRSTSVTRQDTDGMWRAYGEAVADLLAASPTPSSWAELGTIIMEVAKGCIPRSGSRARARRLPKLTEDQRILQFLNKLVRAVRTGKRSRALSLVKVIRKMDRDRRLSVSADGDLDLISTQRARKDQQARVDEGQRERKHQAVDEWTTKMEGSLKSDIRQCLDLALQRQRNHVQVNCVRTEEGVVEAPTEVRELVRRYYQSLLSREEGGAGDEEQREVGVNSAFASLMDPISVPELSGALAKGPRRKAPGPSSMIPEMLYHLPPRGVEALAAIMNAWMGGELDREACASVIVLLPKKKEWTGRLDDLRPISLLEPVRRIFTAILARRLSRIQMQQPIIRGHNFGFVPGRLCSDAIRCLGGAVTDAVRTDNHLWIGSLDVRKAYDSVSWPALFGAMRKMGMPESFVGLLRNMYLCQEITVRSAVGDTAPFQPSRGLAQGCSLSPTLWNVFYDQLLVQIGQGWPAADGRPSYVAFADDLTLMARSASQLQDMLTYVQGFLRRAGMELNAAKCIVGTTNKDAEEAVFTLQDGRGRVHTLPAAVKGRNTIRILGVDLAMDGSHDQAVAKATREIEAALRALARYRVPAKVIVEAINIVVRPKLLHRLIGSSISQETAARIQAPWVATVKKALRLPPSTPNSALHTAEIGLRQLHDSLVEQEVTDIIMLLNSEGPVAAAYQRRMETLRVERDDSSNPANSCRQVSHREIQMFGDVAWVCRALRQYDIQLQQPGRDCRSNPDIQGLIPEAWTRPIGRLLNGRGTVSLAQVLTPAGKHVAAAVDGRSKVTGQRFLTAIMARVCVAATNILATPFRAAVEAVRIRLPRIVRQPTPGSEVTAYGDGSVIHAGTGQASGAFAVTWTEGGERKEVWGRAPYPISSTFCEIQAFLAALQECPKTSKLTYLTDSQALVATWMAIRTTARVEMRRPYWHAWDEVRLLADRFSQGVQVAWVPGHAGNAGNERADYLADQAHTRDPTIDLEQCPSRKASEGKRPFTPVFGSTQVPVPVYMRAYLKLANRARHQVRLEASLARQTWFPAAVDIETQNAALRRNAKKRRIVVHAEDKATATAIRWRHNRLPVAQNMSTWTGGQTSPACHWCGQPETQMHLLTCPQRIRENQACIDDHVRRWGRRRQDTIPPQLARLLQLDSQEGAETIASFVARYPSRAVRTCMEEQGMPARTINSFLGYLVQTMAELFRTKIWFPRCLGRPPGPRVTWRPRVKDQSVAGPAKQRGRPKGATTTGAQTTQERSEYAEAARRAQQILLKGEASPGLWSLGI